MAERWQKRGRENGLKCGIVRVWNRLDHLSKRGTKMDKKAALKICELCLLALSGGILMLPFLGEEAFEKTLIFPEE